MDKSSKPLDLRKAAPEEKENAAFQVEAKSAAGEDISAEDRAYIDSIENMNKREFLAIEGPFATLSMHHESRTVQKILSFIHPKASLPVLEAILERALRELADHGRPISAELFPAEGSSEARKELIVGFLLRLYDVSDEHFTWIYPGEQKEEARMLEHREYKEIFERFATLRKKMGAKSEESAG